jgi:PTB domain-containing engulfment adapter protein 1
MLIETSSPKNTFAPIVPPRNQITSTIEALKPSVGTKLEGLLLNSDSDSDFDPRADEQEMTNGSKISNDLFGFEPSKTSGQQLFNSGSFTDGTTNNFTSNHSSPPPLCELESSFSAKTITDLCPLLVAPPPKTAAPRRINGSQDLFGSDPFQPISKSFNVSIILTHSYFLFLTSRLSHKHFARCSGI